MQDTSFARRQFRTIEQGAERKARISLHLAPAKGLGLHQHVAHSHSARLQLDPALERSALWLGLTLHAPADTVDGYLMTFPTPEKGYGAESR